MSTSLVYAAYIVAAILFILALAGLSRHESAKHGNLFGIAGMAIALVATIILAINGVYRSGLDEAAKKAGEWGLGMLVLAMDIGAAIGIHRILRPQAPQ